MNIFRKVPDNFFLNFIFSSIIAFKYSIVDKYYLIKGRLLLKQKKNQSKLVSVLIPTYNRCPILLERAIPSILAQTYKNFEIIIIDDGSEDDTYETVKSLNHSQIKIFKNSRKDYRYPNKALYHWFAGGVSALNYGWQFCSGDYIARIDDDDIWTETHIEKLLNFLEETNSEFVYSHILAKMSQDEKEKVITNQPDPLGNTCTWLFKSYLKNFKINIHCWRKNNNRVFDVDVQNRMFKAGVRISYLNEVTALYYPRPGENFAGSLAYIDNAKMIESKNK
jgi:glycosyltransferase involved in cell wall biosynthesis